MRRACFLSFDKARRTDIDVCLHQHHLQANTPPTMATIAFLGLGAMGQRMVRRLLDVGHSVYVYNRTASRADMLVEAGAHRAETPREAAAQAEIVISMVTDNEASKHIWLDPSTGAVNGLQEGSIAIECSTLTPEWARELSEVLTTSSGVAFIDAPVVGTRPHAEKGILTFLLGGNAATLDAVREVLGVMGQTIHHVGPTGSGMVLKLIVNALFGIQVAALGEFVGLMRKAKLDVQQAVDMLTSMPVASPVLKLISGLMLKDAPVTNFPIALVEKDLRYFGEMAATIQGEGPTTEAVRQVYADAIEKGYGARDISGIGLLFKE